MQEFKQQKAMIGTSPRRTLENKRDEQIWSTKCDYGWDRTFVVLVHAPFGRTAGV